MTSVTQSKFMVLVKGAILIFVVLLPGCSQLLGRNCTDILQFGIHLELVDSTSEQPLEVTELIAIAREDEFVDSVRVEGTIDFPIQLVPERPGTYSTSVRAEGYETWERSGIEVTMDEEGCHVQPVEVVVVLEVQANDPPQ